MDIFTKDGKWFELRITGDVPLALEEGNRAGFWRRSPTVSNEFDTVISTATGFTTYASKHFIKRFSFENNRMETADLEPSYNQLAVGVPGYWERLGGSFSAASDTLTSAAIRLTNAIDGDHFAEAARAFFDFRKKCLADAKCKVGYGEALTLGPRQEREIEIYSDMIQLMFAIGEVRAILKFSISSAGRTLIRLARSQSGSVPSRFTRQPFATNREAADAASENGWNSTGQNSNRGTKIYYDPEGKMYYTRDWDSHSGGSWKGARSPGDLESQSTRSGTYDRGGRLIGR